MAFDRKRKLPRLGRSAYQGHAVVFWTNTLEQHARGRLTPSFHNLFRELMLHAAAREQLFCPVYCLMPDHFHLIWMGLRGGSDQMDAMRFLRINLEPALGNGRRWRHQAHDHVLREEEHQPDAFVRICCYMLANPVRAGLAEREADWPYSGAVIPGYPSLHPLQPGYWELSWRIYVRQCEAGSPPQSPP